MSVNHKIANICDKTTKYVGNIASFMVIFMVIMMIINVAMRYIFSLGDPWQTEIVRFAHASLFMLGAAYALQCNKHVRVDVFYQAMSERKKALVNLFGTLLFLLPTSFAMIFFSYDYVTSSWRILEASPEYNGMPGIFILKSMIWLAAILLIVQAIAVIARRGKKMGD